jgi:hypothetical protein
MPVCNIQVPIRILDPIQSILSGISSDEIWTQALAGKNVLVVSSFSETIAMQFMHRKDLHQQTVLPEFSLHTCAPPSTNGAIFWKGNYSKNLDKFIKLINKSSVENSIDIALISAGAYGLPIMASLKSQGISSIYMGGSLQLLFGIMGNRWRRIEAIQSLITPSWVMAPKENRPFGYRLIEDGSYW